MCAFLRTAMAVRFFLGLIRQAAGESIVARELAPARLRSSRKRGECGLPEAPQ
jgi:hypothetical protein